MSFFSRLGAPLHASKMAFSLIIFIASLAVFRAIDIPFLLHAVVCRLPTGVSIGINSNIGSPGTFARTCSNCSFETIPGCMSRPMHSSRSPLFLNLRLSGKPALYVLNRRTSPAYFLLARIVSIVLFGQTGFPVGVGTPLRSSSRLMFKAAGNPLYSHMGGNLRRC